jgi:cyclophilin family peptidyl-prolyl cis-trans isomerase
MIGKLFAKFLRKRVRGRKSRPGKRNCRRITIEPLESRRLLAATGSISGFAYLDTHNFGVKDANEAGFAGLTVELRSVGSQENLSSVSGVGPTQTNSDGSYSFTGLAAGTYEVLIKPSAKLAAGKPSPGSAGGSAGTNEIQLTLADNQAATDYNFALLGVQTNYISLRMMLASTGTLSHYLATMHTAPAVAIGSGSSTATTSYAASGPAVPVASSNVSITAADSPTLASMTVAIANLSTGGGDVLSAATAGTPLASNYSAGVLSIFGVADVATYESVLQSVTYQNTNASAAGNRTISVTVNDGTSKSTVAAATIAVVPGSQSVPTVTTNPAAKTINAGGAASFTAASSGNPAPTVQWQVNTGSGYTNLNDGGVYTGSTSGTLNITGATAAMNGYQYQAVFTNAAGTATSTAATLTVDSVTTQPTSQTANSGGTVSFTAATSSASDSVQWKVSADGGTTFSNIAGATATTYSFTVAAAQNGNQYAAVFTNAAGSLTTNPATLTVTNVAPTVTTNPASQTVSAGGTVTFTAAASSNPAATVQWQVSTDSGQTFSDISGATSASYSFTAAAADNGKQYKAVFTNTIGAVATTVATLTVNVVPTVTTNPAPQTVDAGGTTTFTAAASGSPTATVQWKVSTDSGTTFNNIAGATSLSYSFTAAATDNGNQYEAVFTNAAGTVTSNAATLTVHFAPTVTTNPVAQTVNAGSTILSTFTAAASGNPTPTVQWKMSTDGGTTFSDIAGATSTSYTFTATAADNGNRYEAVFTNTVGTVATTAATLTVNTALTLTTNPTSQTVNAGATATFSAAASGRPTPTMQWKVSTDNGQTFSDIAGATSTTYSFTTSAADNGNLYEAVFTNSVGTTTSDPATLTVDYAPTVTINPTAQTVDGGTLATFTAAASGNPAPTVQWRESIDGGATFTDIVGATSTTYSFTPARMGNGKQFEAVFSNSLGSVTTNPATLTVYFVPTVTTDPTAQTVNTGATATFTAAATGNPAAAVQWKVSTDGGQTFSDISGATSTTYSFTAADADNGNQYEAVFTNSLGTATSNPASLTVNSAPVVTANPAAETVNSGDTVTFTAASGGSPTPAVQWKVSSDGGNTFTDIPGATSTTYSFTAAVADNGKQYEALFTNSAGSATTAPATLTVTYSLAITSTPATAATVDQVYLYTLQTNAPSGDAITVTPGTLPAGMTFDAATATFTWTPTAAQAGTSPSFTATVKDSANNTATLGPIYVAVAAANGLTVVAPAAAIVSGSPVLVAFNNANTGTPNFTVTTSSSSDPSGSNLTATVMPQTNQVLKIVTDHGEMDFQLLDNYTPNTVSHFVNLVNSGTYTNTDFYRIIQSFMVQGGSGGTGSTIPVELNADLRFTSSGLLAMANNGVDGNSSEFFVTSPDDTSNGFLDFRYTIFGKLISGDNVRQAIAATPVTTNSSTNENSKPLTAPKILSMSVTTETNAGVLMLKAASTAQGPYTVALADGLGHTQTFQVEAGTNSATSAAITNSFDPPNPWVQPINGNDKIFLAANTPVTFTPQGESAAGVAAPQVDVQLLLNVTSVAGAEVDTSFLTTSTATTYPAENPNPNLTLTKNGSSYTVTPTAGYYGVQFLEVTAQSATAASWDSGSGVDPIYRAFVPVYVAPPAPVLSSISAGGQTITGTTSNNNSSTAKALSFNVTGAIAGATVSVYVDGGTTAIATGTVASGATAIALTTDGTSTLSDGAHTFTIAQSVPTLATTAYVNWNSNGPGTQFTIPASTVLSAASSGVPLTIDSTAL